ncbi:hypothetical protein Tco_0467654 [Tanacetum coccineum]
MCFEIPQQFQDSSTNEVNTAYGVSTANTQVSTASTQVITTNLSDATVYAFLASQPNGSHLVHEDLEQIHEDDLEEMDLKWQLALLSMRTRNFMVDEKVPTDMALMAFSDSEFNKSEFNLATYKRGLASVEEQLVFYKKNEVLFCEQLAVLKRDISYKDSEISVLKSELEKLKQEKESNQLKIENFDNASKSLDKLTVDQIPDNSRKGLGFANCNYHQKERVVSGKNYTRVNYNYSAKKAHLSAHRDIVPRAVLIKTGLSPLNTARPINTAHPKTTDYSARPIVKGKVNTARLKAVNTSRPNTAVVNAARANQSHPQKEDQGYVDSGCSRQYNTACYDQNRFISSKPQQEPPYELFRVRLLELHVRFLEDKPIITGDGPKWLFDIDVLTKSMNYVSVVAGTNFNDFVGTKESIGACHSSEETGFSQDYILMPLWKDGSPFDSSLKDASNDEPQPSNDARKKDDESGIDD